MEATNVYCYCYVVVSSGGDVSGGTENVICLCQNRNYSRLHMNLISFRWKLPNGREKTISEKPEIFTYKLSFCFICLVFPFVS